MGASLTLHFNYRPLEVSPSIVVSDSVADIQSYSVADGGYAPDYTLTNLCLEPRIYICDGNGIKTSGLANSLISSVVWTVTESGTTTTISDSNADYKVVRTASSDGLKIGTLLVKRNLNPNRPLTFTFTCDLADATTGEVHKITLQHTVRCISIDPELSLSVDCGMPSWDPLRDPDSRTVTATLFAGTNKAADSQWVCLWEALRNDGTWSECGTDFFDWCFTVSGKSITVNQRTMGGEQKLRCRAAYDAAGSPSVSDITEQSPTAYFSLKRRIPSLYATIEQTRSLAGGQTQFTPTARVRTHGQKGEVSLTTGDISLKWYVRKASATSLGAKTAIADGQSPTIKDVSKIDSTYGGVLDLEIVDNGPLAAWADSDGSVIMGKDAMTGEEFVILI